MGMLLFIYLSGAVKQAGRWRILMNIKHLQYMIEIERVGSISQAA